MTTNSEMRPSLGLLLVSADKAMQSQVHGGRWLRYFLLSIACSLFVALAIAARVDVRAATLRSLDKNDQLTSMSDRQVDDEMHKALRVAQVKTVAIGAVRPPVDLGFACLSVLTLSWFFRCRIAGKAVLPIASVMLVPTAIADVLDGIFALRHSAIAPDASSLSPRTLADVFATMGLPMTDPLNKLAATLDFFSLWAAWIMAAGLLAARTVSVAQPKTAARTAPQSERTILLGTLAAWLCFRLLTQASLK